nr:EOG090X0NBY [Sida crystallina]
MATANVRMLSILRKNGKFVALIKQSNAISTAPVVLNSTDVPTHTGQVWEEGDSRLARFEGNPKQINSRFAIDLIAKVPPKESHNRVVSCNGGGGALGHPKVYINLDQPGNHTCGYCGLRFFKDDHHGHH